MTTLFQKQAKTLTIASWNVNSVRARLPVLESWLRLHNPDVVCLQETKCEDKNFPTEVFSDLGYNSAHFGQKTFNGVAILSKFPFDEIVRDIPNLEHDQARYIEAGISAFGQYFRVASIYVPNGQEVGSDKYDYKLKYLEALRLHMQHLLSYDEMALFCGDYNIAPTDNDVYDPASWHEKILCSTPERKAFAALTHLGYTDILGFVAPPPYTWWDYRAGSFQKNQGLRIDHILASPKASDRVLFNETKVDKDVRGLEKSSDHAPVIVALTL